MTSVSNNTGSISTVFTEALILEQYPLFGPKATTPSMHAVRSKLASPEPVLPQDSPQDTSDYMDLEIQIPSSVYSKITGLGQNIDIKM